MTSRNRLVAAALAAACCLGGTTYGGDTISVSLWNNATYRVTGQAGVEPRRGWNNIQLDNSDGPIATASLVDDSGNAAASLDCNRQHSWQDMAGTASQDETMMSSYADNSTAGGVVFTVSGLGPAYTANGYSVIVCMKGTDSMGAGTPAEFGYTVDDGTKSEERWCRYLRNPFSGFRQTFRILHASAQGTTDDCNYGVYHNLTGSSFTIALQNDPSNPGAGWARAAMAGFQVVANDPEPSIGFNHAGNQGNTLALSDVAGAAPYAQKNWNNLATDWQGNNGAVPDTVYDSLGNIVGQDNLEANGIRIEYDSNTTWNNGITATTADRTLMRGYLDDHNGDPSQPYFILKNIPYARYRIVVYVDGDQSGESNENGPYWLEMLDGTPLSPQIYAGEFNQNDGGDFAGSFLRTPLTSTVKGSAVDGNYIVFEPLQLSEVRIRGQRVSGTRAPINGFQIVSVPETGTLFAIH